MEKLSIRNGEWNQTVELVLVLRVFSLLLLVPRHGTDSARTEKGARGRGEMLGPLEREMNGGCAQMGNGMGYSSSTSEEEASALPVHTKVVVTGNNRTKSVLIGLQGVVKKAVGLGGWHWLVLIVFFFSCWLIRLFSSFWFCSCSCV
jgi:hypothetical protein